MSGKRRHHVMITVTENKVDSLFSSHRAQYCITPLYLYSSLENADICSDYFAFYCEPNLKLQIQIYCPYTHH
jgi:hypothetical protein